MAERATVNQSTQIGKEATPGTVVAASKRLLTIGPSVSPKHDSKLMRPQGRKYPTSTLIGKEWVEATWDGGLSYTDIVYVLAGVITNPTPATSGGGTTWQFEAQTGVAAAPATYTIELGDQLAAVRWANALFTTLTVTWAKDSIDVKADMIGQAFNEGATLTASPTDVPSQPGNPADTCFFLDSTSAGIGTTKLLRAFAAELAIGPRWGPVFAADCEADSYVATVEEPVDATIKVTVETDAQGLALIQAWRDGSTRFFRWATTGAVIGAGPAKQTFQVDAAVKVGDVGAFKDQDGVYAADITLDVVEDATWGHGLQVEVINDLASL